MERQYDQKVKHLRTDNRREFINCQLIVHLRKQGLLINLCSLHSLTKRFSRSHYCWSELVNGLWEYAALATNYIKNKTFSKPLKKQTSNEILSVTGFISSWCMGMYCFQISWILIALHKYDMWSITAIIIGYVDIEKLYYLQFITKQEYLVVNIRFEEQIYWSFRIELLYLLFHSQDSNYNKLTDKMSLN